MKILRTNRYTNGPFCALVRKSDCKYRNDFLIDKISMPKITNFGVFFQCITVFNPFLQCFLVLFACILVNNQ